MAGADNDSAATQLYEEEATPEISSEEEPNGLTPIPKAYRPWCRGDGRGHYKKGLLEKDLVERSPDPVYILTVRIASEKVLRVELQARAQGRRDARLPHRQGPIVDDNYEGLFEEDSRHVRAAEGGRRGALHHGQRSPALHYADLGRYRAQPKTKVSGPPPTPPMLTPLTHILINPCYRPELDVLIEMEDGNYTLAKGFLPSYICDVMQTWEGLEEEDRVAIVDACATIKFDIPMGLNSYPDMDEDSNHRIALNLKYRVAEAVEDTASARASEMGLAIRQHSPSQRFRDKGFTPPPGLSHLVVHQQKDETKEAYITRSEQVVKNAVMSRINADLAKWLDMANYQIQIPNSASVEIICGLSPLPATPVKDGPKKNGYAKLRAQVKAAEEGRDTAEEEVRDLKSQVRELKRNAAPLKDEVIQMKRLKEEVNRSVILVNRADAATRNKQRQLESRDRDLGIAKQQHLIDITKLKAENQELKMELLEVKTEHKTYVKMQEKIDRLSSAQRSDSASPAVTKDTPSASPSLNL